MIKVCYVVHSSEHKVIGPISRITIKEGIDFCFVTKAVDARNFCLENNLKNFDISYILNDKNVLSDKEISALDLKYGPPGIREVCNSDVQLSCLFKKDDKSKIQAVAKAILFWEKFFDDNKIDCLVVNETASFPPRTAYLVAKYKKIPLIQLTIGPVDDCFSMSDMGELYSWSELTLPFNETKKLSPEETLKIYDLIKKRTKDGGKMTVYFVLDSLLKSIKNLIGLFIRDNKKNRLADPIKVAALIYGQERLWKRMIWSYFTRHFFKYDKPEKDEKYIYFPFFSGKETYYLANEHYYSTNQVSLFKEVAYSLPVGYFLYTKEHPVNPGDFSYTQLKELKTIPNIKVLHPSASSQNLISNCSAVATVEGTVGWEGLLSKKPVVCIGGMPYYAYSTLVYKVKNISDLSRVLWEAIKNGEKIYSDKEAERLWFINQVISTCGQGGVYSSSSGLSFNTDEENINKIAESLSKKIHFLINK